MKILDVLLIGFKPMSVLNQMTEFYMKIDGDLTLITGTNGCGKTRLLKALNPSAANRQDYYDYGLCRLTIEHNNSTYVLESNFKEGGKYYFKKDGIELNEGFTKTYQNTLVLRELNYSPFIHKVLIGEINFTELSPQLRKDLLTDISPLKLDYIIEVFEKLKIANKENTSILKHITLKLEENKNKLQLLDINENSLLEQIELEDKIKDLVGFTSRQLPSTNTLLNEINSLSNQLKDLEKQYVKFSINSIKEKDITDTESLNQHIGYLSSDLNSSIKSVKEYTKKLENLNGVSGNIKESNLTEEEINIRISLLESKLNTFKNNYFINTNQEEILEKLFYFFNTVNSLIDDFNIDVLKEYTIKDIERILNEEKELNEKISQTKYKLSIIEDKIIHRKQDIENESIDIKCPKCFNAFKFQKNNYEEDLLKLTDNKNKGLNILSALEKDKKYLSNELVIAYDFIKCRNYYKDLIVQIKLPFIFYNGFDDFDTFIKKHNSLINHINTWIYNTKESIEFNKVQHELKQYKDALNTMNILGGDFNNQISTLNKELEDELQNQIEIEYSVNYYKTILNDLTKYNNIVIKAEILINELNIKLELLSKADISEQANVILNDLYGRLGILKNKVSQKLIIESNLKDIEKDFEDLSNKQIRLTKLIEVISLLISEQMEGFLNDFINQVNLILGEIWDYDFNIGMCGYDKDKLSYKFPMLIDGKEIADIIEGSSGQKEIVNLAFSIIIRQYLGLGNYPLYLDETGAKFDEVHRAKLMYYIHNLIEYKLCTHIFMINHYSSITGGLINHNVVVLDKRNITVPDNYNENVIIKYKGE